MSLMSTCLGRLGSRYSIIFDPHRAEVHYGALGLMCQTPSEMVAGLDDGRGNFYALPFSKTGRRFYIVDQQMTMTSIVWEAYCTELGVKLTVKIVAPFWPQDEKTSIVPAYILHFHLQRFDRVRWTFVPRNARRRGILKFGIRMPSARYSKKGDSLAMTYPVTVNEKIETGEGGEPIEKKSGRTIKKEGSSTDLFVPLAGKWRMKKDLLEIPFDLSAAPDEQRFSLAMTAYVPDALLERMGKPMNLKYTGYWSNAGAVAAFIRAEHVKLCDKSRRFDEIWSGSSLPEATRSLTALAFQSYLMCTTWCTSAVDKDWFGVWEGSCWHNSTVDVSYNEAMFYFACWPQLLEMLFETWARHVNDPEGEERRQARINGRPLSKDEKDKLDFRGAIMEHDVGDGWTVNGQDYHHAMPVEENANFLLLLYSHGMWWGREALFKKYNGLNKKLVEYLFWTDSTGNGFPDRGTVNTIDDGMPAVQYGRDNVYLGIKRLAALHAAGKMFRYCGEAGLAVRCCREVKKAVRTLNAGWLGDHWGVCLDKSAKGLRDSWTGKPLPYRTLQGWDAYSPYATNGLLPLMLIDDLPPGILVEKLRRDIINAGRKTLSTYGCTHSSMDTAYMCASINIWRDCAAGYLGENLLANSEKYWNLQLFSNGPGAEKPNCFTESLLTNNLVWYPRGAASFGIPMSMARLSINRSAKKAAVSPIAAGRWPLIALADWKKGEVPFVVAENVKGKLIASLQGKTGKIKLSCVKQSKRPIGR